VSAHSLKGEHLLFLLTQFWRTGVYPRDPTVWHALVPASATRSHQLLHQTLTCLLSHRELWQMPAPDALLATLLLIEKASRKQAWQPQSFLRNLCSLEASFAAAPRHCHASVTQQLHLSSFAVWRLAKRCWERLSIRSQPTHQAAATFADICVAIGSSTDPAERAYLMLLWSTCGRKGDVGKLRANDVRLTMNGPEAGRLQSFFREGKVVHSRKQLFHQHSHVPAPWRAELHEFLTSSAHSGRLFAQRLESSNRVTELLRQARPELNCRSVRRGALQAMAEAKVDEQDLLLLSNHSNVATLRRYLDWNRSSARNAEKAQEAARHLEDLLLLPPPSQQ